MPAAMSRSAEDRRRAVSGIRLYSSMAGKPYFSRRFQSGPITASRRLRSVIRTVFPCCSNLPYSYLRRIHRHCPFICWWPSIIRLHRPCVRWLWSGRTAEIPAGTGSEHLASLCAGSVPQDVAGDAVEYRRTD